MSRSASGAFGDGHESGGGWRPLKKKQKAQKMPKRGPGVAELEKILRQQQVVDIQMHPSKPKVEMFSSSWTSPQECNHYAPLSIPHPLRMKPQTLYPSSPLTKSITPSGTQLGAFNQSHQQQETLYENDHSLSGFGHSDDGNKNVGCTVFKGIILPDKVPCPTKWSSSETRQSTHPPSVMRPFPSKISSAIPPQLGRNLHVEPPSNQRSHRWLPQENLTDKLHELSTRSHIRVHDYDPRKPDLREINSAYGKATEQNSKVGTAEYGHFSGNFLTLSPPTIPSPATKFLREDSTSHAFSSPHHNIDLGKNPEPREAAHKDRFYSFLQLKETKELEGADGKRDGKGENSVDLNLRL